MDSVLSNVYMAREAKRAGKDAGIAFAGEALMALAGEAMLWPRGLQDVSIRWAMADNGKEMGLPISGRGDGRQLDRRALLGLAKEAGVALYGCPPWVKLLGVQSRLPEGIAAVSEAEMITMLTQAKRVVGGF
ncbi:MAG: hypothetical protein EXR49_01265 [Dehalococcoidia bacterium]|nr:hypothetical protein [Dehalococcoidia bacterium]